MELYLYYISKMLIIFSPSTLMFHRIFLVPSPENVTSCAR